MHARIVGRLLALGSVVALAACGSDGSTNNKGSTGVSTGSLTVTVSTPNGMTGTVTITGPSAYSKTISATTTLTGLVPGSYALSATSVVSSAPIVSTLDSGLVSGPVTVTANETATATVTYGPRPGTGALWVTNLGGSHVLDAYSAASLAQSGSPAPADSIATGNIGTVSTGLAFDSHGNAWVAAPTGDSIIEYTPAQLAGGSATPAATLLLPSPGNTPLFDANGNLWVVISNDGISSVVVEFSASQVTGLPSRSNPRPVQVVTVPSPSGGGDAFGAAFDAAGNLWVAQQATGEVYKFAAADLAPGTSAATPTDSLTAGTAVGLAFDGSGNLWVANVSGIYGYTAAQLATNTPPSAPRYADVVAVAQFTPVGLAFDNSGDLWVTGSTLAIVELTPAQLTANGSVTPTTTLTVTDGGAASVGVIAFDPHGTGTPLAGLRAPR